MRTLSALFAVLLVSVAMVPAVSAQSEKRFEEELLRDVGIKIEQIVVKNGVARTSSDTITLPKTERPDFSDISSMSGIGLTSDKTKIDLPSMAPSTATLIFNDVCCRDIMWGAIALAVISVYFGVLPGVIIGLAAVALQAIPDYYNFEPEDVYLDVWYVPEPHPLSPIFIEVDYLYN